MKRPISAEAASKKYMQNSAECPFCESCDIRAGEMTGDGGVQLQSMYCDSCGAQFTEVYKLKSIYIDGGPTQKGESIRELRVAKARA